MQLLNIKILRKEKYNTIIFGFDDNYIIRDKTMIYAFLANGFEEIEALTVIDILRRAEIDIITVSVTSDLEVTGAHGI